MLSTNVGTLLPAFLEGIFYISLFSIPFFRSLLAARKSVADVPTSAAENAGHRRIDVIRAKRLRVTQAVFAAYVWSELCLLFVPIAFSASKKSSRVKALISLIAPGLSLLGYSTSSVRTLGNCTVGRVKVNHFYPFVDVTTCVYS